MRCNLWIYLIQFLVQIETLQIKRKKKQREARSKLRQQVNIVTAFSNFVSYIISIHQSEPKADNFDFPYSQVIGRKSQLWLIFWKSEQSSFSESNRLTNDNFTAITNNMSPSQEYFYLNNQTISRRKKKVIQFYFDSFIGPVIQ